MKVVNFAEIMATEMEKEKMEEIKAQQAFQEKIRETQINKETQTTGNPERPGPFMNH